MEKLEVDSKSGSEEEFFDCLGKNGYLPAFEFIDYFIPRNTYFNKPKFSIVACI